MSNKIIGIEDVTIVFSQNKNGLITSTKIENLTNEQVDFVKECSEKLEANGVPKPYGAVIGASNIVVAKIKDIQHLVNRA